MHCISKQLKARATTPKAHRQLIPFQSSPLPFLTFPPPRPLNRLIFSHFIFLTSHPGHLSSTYPPKPGYLARKLDGMKNGEGFGKVGN